jgi:hypothetical protein
MTQARGGAMTAEEPASTIVGARVLVTIADPLYRLVYRALDMTALRYGRLYTHLRRHPARTILEIGVHRGRRSVGFIRSCLKTYPPSEVHFFGIDLFDLYESAPPSVDLAAEHALTKRPLPQAAIRERLIALLPSSNIHLYAGPSQEVFAAHWREMPPMDFVFIDGGHSLETIQSDFEFASRLLSKEGYIFLDDYWLTDEAGCRRLVRSLSSQAYDVRIYPVPDCYKNAVGFIWLVRVRPRGAEGE